VPIVVQRAHSTRKALGKSPLLAATGAARPGFECVPYCVTARDAHPAIARAGHPLAIWAVNANRHETSRGSKLESHEYNEARRLLAKPDIVMIARSVDGNHAGRARGRRACLATSPLNLRAFCFNITGPNRQTGGTIMKRSLFVACLALLSFGF